MRDRVTRPVRHGARYIVLLMIGTIGCSHALAVKNLDMYATPVRLGASEHNPRIAVLPYSGQPDGLYYFNAIVDRLSADPGIASIQTDYIARKGRATGSGPDLILSIQPHVEYRSSGWNFLINWPGFLIFTPAWNGYVYHADVMTTVAIHDGLGNVLNQAQIPVSYSIRHAEMDRTIFTGLTWLEVSALALIGGIYNANVFDRDVIGPLQVHVKDNYGNFVANQIQPKIRSAADAVMAKPEAEQAQETMGDETMPDVAEPPRP